jgi:hypothetical protein
MKYRNGTVLPSALLKDSNAKTSLAFNKNYKNFSLKAGIVVESYPVDDKKNISKLVPEYDVIVIEQDEGKSIVPITYRNCISANGLGAIADFFEMRLRKQKKIKNKKSLGKDFAGQDGAIVLLLCLDGSSEKGIIIGALNHPDRKSKLKGDGQILAGEFNGVSISVNDDGSANLTFKGATENDGTPKDSSQGNTTIDIEKDGSLQFKNKGVTQRMSKGGDYLISNEGSSTIDSKKSITIKTSDKFSLDAASDANMKMAKLALQAQGSANIKAQSFDITGETKIDLKTKMLSIQAETMLKVQSTTISLDGLVFVGGPGGQPLVLPTTQMVGIGNLGLPVVSYAVGPFTMKTFAV